LPPPAGAALPIVVGLCAPDSNDTGLSCALRRSIGQATGDKGRVKEVCLAVSQFVAVRVGHLSTRRSHDGLPGRRVPLPGPAGARRSALSAEDQRDQVLKMDWTTLPLVTNSAAVGALR